MALQRRRSLALQAPLLFALCVLRSAAEIHPRANRGMIIDAGSGGSRLHLFEWDARIFTTLPPPTSFPSQRTDWTDRMKPGLASYAEDPSKVGEHLQPLVDFAIDKLKGREKEFHTYPIFLKATGGMRQLPFKKREAIMNAVRAYMNDKSKVPFYFEQDFARIISGEEEAIYAWTAVNFLMGTLVPQLVGTGTVDANETYGALALGGASAQIAFFLPSQDISANMFKLQVGAQKHWNLYGHSFLWFGLDLARTRFHNRLAEDAVSNESSATSASSASSASSDNKYEVDKKDHTVTAVNYCFPTGYEEIVEWDGRKVKLVAPSHSDLDVDDVDNDSGYKGRMAAVRGGGKDDDVEQDDEFDDKIYDYDDDPPRGREAKKLALCVKQTLPLFRLEANDWCEFSHGKGQCSYNGVYQPPLPDPNGSFGHFVAITGYHYAWDFFGLPARAPISEFAARAKTMCTYSMDELAEYMKLPRNKLGDTKQAKSMLPYYCFMASFVLNQLVEGYGFSLDQEITVLDTYKGHKVSWALGAMLYEINALPWAYAPEQASALEMSLAWAIPLLVGAVLGAVLLAIFNWFQRRRSGYIPVHTEPEGDVALAGVTVQRADDRYHQSGLPRTTAPYATA